MLELQTVMTRIRLKSGLHRAASTRIIYFKYYRAVRKIESSKLHTVVFVMVVDEMEG